jgi:hypothetical protein
MPAKRYYERIREKVKSDEDEFDDGDDDSADELSNDGREGRHSNGYGCVLDTENLMVACIVFSSERSGAEVKDPSSFNKPNKVSSNMHS